MRRITCLIMCLAISTAFIACSGKTETLNNSVTSETSGQTSSIQDNESSVKTSESKTLEAGNDKTATDKNDKADTTAVKNNETSNAVNDSKNSSSSSNNSASAAKEKVKTQAAQPAKSNSSPKDSNGQTTQTAAQPKNNKVIVIDPGHANRSNLEKEPLAPGSSEMKIKDGGGAQGIVTKTPEYKINMNVAVKLKSLLEGKGYTVVMTKTQDSQSLGNVERANIWNAANAALVLRIHADSSDNNSAKGASMLVPSPINDNTKAIYAASKSYGKTVLDTLTKEVGMKNRGVTEHADMTGFNWSKVPVILVEMGFLSNADEDKLLSNDEYENKIAKALADGIAAAVK